MQTHFDGCKKLTRAPPPSRIQLTANMAAKSVAFLPSHAPFSYAILGLSAFLGVPYTFDVEQTENLILTVDGVTSSNPADALHQLADTAGRAGDSQTVSRIHTQKDQANRFVQRVPSFTTLPHRSRPKLHLRISRLLLIPSTTTWHIVPLLSAMHSLPWTGLFGVLSKVGGDTSKSNSSTNCNLMY